MKGHNTDSKGKKRDRKNIKIKAACSSGL